MKRIAVILVALVLASCAARRPAPVVDRLPDELRQRHTGRDHHEMETDRGAR